MSLTKPDPSTAKASGMVNDAETVFSVVDAIARSEAAGRSERLGDVLRYIVKEELEGRGERLKAYAIATGVLGRPDDFDPAADSIVRVEMARLRTALKLFYAGNPDVPLLIDIPKGGYRPVISPRVAAAPDQSASTQGSPVNPGRRRNDPRSLLSGWVTYVAVGVIAAVLLAALIGVFWRAGRTQDVKVNPALPPLLLVAPVTIATADETMKVLEGGLTSELVAELSAFQAFAVAFGGKLNENLRQQDKGRSVYALEMRLVIEGRNFTSITTLQDAVTRVIRENIVDRGVLPEGHRFPALARSAHRIAGEVGRPFGLVTQAELIDLPADAAGAYACRLSLRKYMMDWTATDRERLRTCALSPTRGDDLISLSLSAAANFDEARRNGDALRSQLLDSAKTDIEAAMAIRANDDLARLTAAHIYTCLGDPRGQRIIEDVVRTRANNPNALANAAYLYAFVLNDAAKAVTLAKMAADIAIEPQPDSGLAEALISLKRGDADSAARSLTESRQGKSPTALILTAAAQGALGKRVRVEDFQPALTRAGLATYDAMNTVIGNECWSEDVKTFLTSALRRAAP
jgi:adenylate cyclase